MVVSLNALLLVGVPLPSIAVSFASQTWCTRHHDEIPWCSVYQHPLLALNILFFFNVTVLFWVISLCQGGSTWLIDPYWTILPILIHMFYATHAHAPHPTTARQLIIPLILLLWSVRLTHSYFRREHWRLGARQDWRFETMRQQWGPVRWRWASFWVAYASQHVLLVGLTLPLHAVVLQGGQPTAWTLLDTLAAALALLGIAIAAVADTQLHRFVQANQRARKAGKPPRLVLDTGLWRYSRHPNYVGEQLWWWALALWALACPGTPPWVVVGPLINTACMVPVTAMVEQRMVGDAERATAYRAYQRRTGCWLPRLTSSVAAGR